jgi:hypothetical protein
MGGTWQLQRLIFAKVEAWIVLLAVILGLCGLVAFSWLVLEAERGASWTKRFGQAPLLIAEAPSDFLAVFKPDDSIAVWNSARFDGRPTGWTIAAAEKERLPDGYVLLSRYDGTASRHVIELVELRSGKVLFDWVPDAEKLLEGAARTSTFPTYWAWDNAHFREIHPLPLENGDLIVKDHYSPLMRVDPCGRLVWMNDSEMFHHSTELDDDGNLWVPGLVEPSQVKGVQEGFYEDDLVKVSLDGTTLYHRSLADILLKGGLAWRMFPNGTYTPDPMHLNDIEPVLADGPYWKKGDLLLSLRNMSMIILFRPEEDRIVWRKAGPWISQHDVDILDDHRIAVYDNNAQDRGGLTYFEGPSSVAVYDFATDTVTRPWLESMKREDVKTAFAGQFTALPGGYAMIEDVTNARFLVFSPNGSVAAEYVNRAEDGRVFHLGWSRYLDRSFGDVLLKAVSKAQCSE